VLLQHAGQRENVAHIIVHYQDLFAFERVIVLPDLARFVRCSCGEVASARCRHQDRSSSSRAGESAKPDHSFAPQIAKSPLSCRRSPVRAVDTTGGGWRWV